MQTQEKVRPLVLVLSDSLAFVGQRTLHAVDDARLWPNVMAAALDADVEVFGDFGWTARDAWYAVGHDVRLWPVLRRADAGVVAVGNFDSAPEPLPSSLWKRIAMIHSPRVRRIASPHTDVRYPCWRGFTPRPQRGSGGPAVQPDDALPAGWGVPVLGMRRILARPTVYAGFHKGYKKADRTIREWAVTADVPLLDTAEVVGDHMLSGRGNPDGMHMGWEGHTAVGEGFARLLADILPARPALNGTSLVKSILV